MTLADERPTYLFGFQAPSFYEAAFYSRNYDLEVAPSTPWNLVITVTLI